MFGLVRSNFKKVINVPHLNNPLLILKRNINTNNSNKNSLKDQELINLAFAGIINVSFISICAFIIYDKKNTNKMEFIIV